jgi:hypothetical protein
MSKFITFIFAITLLIGCINTENKQQNSDNERKQTIEEGESCYVFNNGQDSIKMSIEINNNKAKGDLNFNYYEKDSNTGTFSGTVNGDTLWANYTFTSEGIESSREVVFLKQQDSWIQGYGDVMEKNGGFVFINHNDIRFDNNFVLEKTDCKP